ncbi:MAG: Vitamin B12 dependent methionine synthase activation subunit [Clostridia bacterium]|nr:Vitamin B12 dependent methionine synthase activation subunit [Clostridia bacterium]
MSEIFLINVSDASVFNVNISEIKRYLKIHKHDTQSNSLIEECINEIYQVAIPKAVYSKDCISVENEEVKFAFDTVLSKNLSKNLCECKCAYVFCATLGIEVDRIIQKYAKIEPSKAIVLDSVASALIEEFCDYVNGILVKDKCTCPRFSAGYGDYSIIHQKKLLESLDATRKLGVVLSDSFMMTPSKTVTAVIGIKE